MPDEAQSQNVQDWATGGAGEGQPALSVSNIQTEFDDLISSFANLTSDIGDVPTSARERYKDFLDPSDLTEYLQEGALLHSASNAPNDYNVNQILWVQKTIPFPGEDDIVYRLWIDDVS